MNIWNPGVAHCNEERRFVSPDGTDGGGHISCLAELRADGTCPVADEHHRAWIDSGLDCDDWAASVIAAREACGVFDYEAHPCMREGCTVPATRDDNPWCYLDDLAEVPEIPGFSYRATHPGYGRYVTQ